MMINILLDECLPQKLKYRIEELDSGFVTKTVPEMDWASIADGELLGKAEKEFDIFITSDRNLSFQQPIKDCAIHVILLKAPTNTYEDLLPLIEGLTPVIKAHQPGQFSEVE